MRHTLIVLCVFVCALSTSWAQTKPGKMLSENEFSPAITDCQARDICDLVNVYFHVTRGEHGTTKTLGEELEYGTTMFGWYETRDMSTIEKYVFVQYVRGCAFQSNTYRNLTSRHFLSILHGGNIVSQCSLDWVIDRDDEDPVYTSERETASRHYFAQWAPPKSNFTEPGVLKYYGEEKPILPRLGMLDQPSTAFVRKWENGRILANSVALEFRTCLYLEKDVPRVFRESRDVLPAPIVCHEWGSTFLYDAKSETIVERDFLIDLCKEKDIARSVMELRKPRKAAVPALKVK